MDFDLFLSGPHIFVFINNLLKMYLKKSLASKNLFIERERKNIYVELESGQN